MFKPVLKEPFKKPRHYTYTQLRHVVESANSKWFQERNVLYVAPERLFDMEDAVEEYNYSVKVKLLQWLPKNLTILVSYNGVVSLIEYAD